MPTDAPQLSRGYRGFRNGWWLREGAQISSLHKSIQSNPPTGDDGWEAAVDKCALELWRARGKQGLGFGAGSDADEICRNRCNFHVCRCPIGVALDANMEPQLPKRANRLEYC